MPNDQLPKNPLTSYLTFGRFFNTFINFSPFELITYQIYYGTQTSTPAFLEDILTDTHILTDIHVSFITST